MGSPRVTVHLPLKEEFALHGWCPLQKSCGDPGIGRNPGQRSMPKMALAEESIKIMNGT